MILGDPGGSSIGSSIGKAVAKTVKKSTSSKGSSVGRAMAKANKPRRSSSSSHSSGSYRSSSSSRGSTSSRSSSRSSGSSLGRSVAAAVAKPKPPPSIGSYLGTDSVYQNAVRGQGRTLADLLSELTRRRGEATTQFNTTVASMNRDRTQQLEDLKNEFASRGLIQSGLYGQEQGKFQQQFTDQLNALQNQQTGLLADLLSQEKGYRRENDLALEEAKQQALARRAAKYNIGA